MLPIYQRPMSALQFTFGNYFAKCIQNLFGKEAYGYPRCKCLFDGSSKETFIQSEERPHSVEGATENLRILQVRPWQRPHRTELLEETQMIRVCT